MGFRFIEDGPECGDCTRPYRIELGSKDYRAWDFVLEAVSGHKENWGFIKIVGLDGTDKCYLPYENGEILWPIIPTDIVFWVVTKATASGGWTRMDYILTVKEEIPDEFTVIQTPEH